MKPMTEAPATDAEIRMSRQLAQLAVENQRLQVRLSETDKQRVKPIDSADAGHTQLLESQAVTQAQAVALGELQRRCEELERMAQRPPPLPP